MSPLSGHIARLVIAGGGTGGHIYPGIAVAEEVLRRNPDAHVTFVGTTRGLESRILPKTGFELDTITVSRLKGGGIWARIKGLFRLPIGIFQSWRVLRRRKPQVVLGVGGYASGPALIAAWLTWRPTAIQEQNATPGLTNRWLGKIAKAVFLGFPKARSFFKPKKTVETGNPIRATLAARLTTAADTSARSEGVALNVLIFGGSQGARFLNENLPATLAAFAAAHPDVALTVTHQTGEAERDTTAARYADGPLADRVTTTAFIDDMPSAYAAADLAICRAGALTVAELTAVGLPSLVVPFPFAADDHQAANGQVLVDGGAALMLRQDAWDADRVVSWLGELAHDPTKRAAMADAARTLARLDAASLIVDRLEGIAK